MMNFKRLTLKPMKGSKPFKDLFLFRIVYGLISIFIAIPGLLWAQGEAAALFLRIPPSPVLNGMGEVGTALPNNQAYGFYYNPAHLGYTGQNTNIALQFYPSKTEWLPDFNFGDVTYNNFAINLGYNFKKGSKALPITAGLGYMRGELNFEITISDDQGGPIGTFASKESYNAFGIGVGIDYCLNFNIGLTYKRINSKLDPLIAGTERSAGEAKAGAIDYGVLVTAPVLKLLSDKFDSASIASPYFNISLGYAKNNIGDKLVYTEESQGDPIPRTARLGYALSGGLDFKLRNTSLRAIEIDWSVDAIDLLVNDGGSYQGGLLGDIRIGHNLISGKSDEKVEVHKGYRLHFFDFIQITSGRFDMNYRGNIKTSGVALNAGGFLKTISAYSSNKTIKYLADHFDLQYAHSEIKRSSDNPLSGTTYDSISLVVSGF